MTTARCVRVAMSGIASMVAALFAACTAVPPPRPVAVDLLLPGAKSSGDAAASFAAIANDVRQHAAFVARGDVERYVDEVHAAFLGGATGDAGAIVATLVPGDAAAWVAFARDFRERRELHGRVVAARQATAKALVAGDLEAAVADADRALGEAPPGIHRGAAAAWRAFALGASGAAPETRRAAFAAAIEELAAPSPVMAAQVGLLAHSVDHDAATWTAAVDRLAAAIAASPRLAVPDTWQRALATKPTGSAWPANVPAVMRAAFGPDVDAFGASRPDDVVTYAIAQMHLRRGESIAALAAFRSVDRAEVPPAARGLSQVGQAKALVALGRDGDARAVLAATVVSADPTAAAAGIAQLAAIELAEGRSNVALALLKRALASPKTVWTDRGGALGNLAVARTLLGESADAAWRDAYDGLVAAADVDGLLLCLENEIALRGDKDPAAAATAQQRYDALRAGGLAPAAAPQQR